MPPAHSMETIIVHHTMTIDQQPGPIVGKRPEGVVTTACDFQVSLEFRHPVVSEVTIETMPVTTSRAIVNVANSLADERPSVSNPVYGLVYIVEAMDVVPEPCLEARLPSSRR